MFGSKKSQELKQDRKKINYKGYLCMMEVNLSFDTKNTHVSHGLCCYKMDNGMNKWNLYSDDCESK